MAAPDGWAVVPVAPRLLRGLKPVLRGELHQFFALAGLRFREWGSGAILLRSDGGGEDLITALPLMSKTGAFRADAQVRIRQGSVGLDTTMLTPFREYAMKWGLTASVWSEFQLNLMESTDPLSMLKKLVHDNQAEGPMSLWRLESTRQLWRRLFVFEAVDHLLGGGLPSDLQSAENRRSSNAWTSGLVQLLPATIACGPLVARSQPLAAVLMTPYITQVVALPSHNAFVRQGQMDEWPVGLGRLGLSGPGTALYATDIDAFPRRHAELMLKAVTAGANRLLEHLTAPEEWISTGEFDVDGRRLAWISVRMGLDAVMSLGAEWTSAEATWVAFRALTILQGLWQRGGVGSPSLDQMLDPDRLQTYAVDLFPEGAEKKWATGWFGTIAAGSGKRSPAWPYLR